MACYIVSAPRSGLNWTRFCIEYFLGRRTPGKPLLIDAGTGGDPAFIRSHDALLLTPGKDGSAGAYRYIDPAGTAGDRIVLLLRDPLEIFVRSARKKYRRFDSTYIGNLRFYSSAASPRKRVAYYDELVGDPAQMLDLIAFLQIAPAPGRALPTLPEMRRDWERAGEQSRSLYDRNQRKGGGARTRHEPLNFRFHQAALSASEKAKLWRHLDASLTDDELGLVDRFRPSGLQEPQSWRERLFG